MEDQIIKSILVYNINQKDKIIGKLNNISKSEKLGNIRPYIRKMNENNEFISIKGNNQKEIIDKDIENDFFVEDILIYEYGIFKIYINVPIKNEINYMNNDIDINNINIDEQYQNGEIQINNDNSNDNFNLNNLNNLQQNIFNPPQAQNQFNNNCINPILNNMNDNINNMDNNNINMNHNINQMNNEMKNNMINMNDIENNMEGIGMASNMGMINNYDNTK